MVELFTCSHYRFASAMGQPVRISLMLPRWRPEARDWPVCWTLCVRWRYFNADDWEQQYLAQLDRYGVAAIRSELEGIAAEHDTTQLVLLCFERQIDPHGCHRRTFARWWWRHTRESVPELDPAPHTPLGERWATDQLTQTGPGQYEVSSVEEPTEEE
ncbi:hypothetical protein [Haloechinothrix halophila]|uniref:DUF488 family protein n=1 Tax=Haloechinothrix halophila YIM 93223 TaxID=592678 RepID=W9DRT3_9PSEU|nr:hypothetical protein [Haloechinothrix halophila]ETA66382.1 hypothetical protein AmyhaDRAFT_0136 [Haloechinothrix halophila YIM 93223]